MLLPYMLFDFEASSLIPRSVAPSYESIGVLLATDEYNAPSKVYGTPKRTPPASPTILGRPAANTAILSPPLTVMQRKVEIQHL